MAKKLTPLNQTSAIVVPHGKSEKLFAQHIRACLRLPIYIHPKNTSIQINGLLHELQTNYPNIQSLKSNDKLSLNFEKNKIIGDFKIFTLMDTDDCTEEKKKSYIDNSLFDKYGLKEFIVPIYTSPKLELVLYKSGIISKVFSDSEKVAGYKEIFDIPKLPYGKTKDEELRELSEKLKKNKDTNLEDFIDYCINQSAIRKVQF